MPVIFITSHSEPDLADKAMKENPYGYIIKPFNDHEIKYAIMLASMRIKMIRGIKEKEKELRHQKNFYNTILNSQSDWIAVIDRHNNITFSNDMYKKKFGDPESDDKKNKSSAEKKIIGEEAFISDVFLTGTMNGCEKRMTDISGRERIFSISASPVFSDDIGVDRVVLSGRDITRMVTQKESLAKMQEILNFIIEIAPIGIILTKSDGTITLVNKTFESLLGQESSSITWMNISEIVKGGMSRVIKNAAGADHDCSETMDLEFKKTDGSYMLAKTVVSCFLKPIDPNYKMIFFVTDVSFEKKLEKKQIKLQNHIETMIREMDNLSEMLLETSVYNESIKANKFSFDAAEKRIIKHIESGHSSSEIAKKLGVAEITIKKRLTKIYSKLGIKNKYQLLEYIHSNYIPEK